jgi:hypothetical protein
MQETEFNAVRLLIAPTHHRVLTKVYVPNHRESKIFNGKNHDQALTRTSTTEPKVT